MRVLIACEESQTVCKAFRAKGHEAYSCDIQDCSGGHPEWHIKDDVLKHLEGWDLIIAHPPCTYLTPAGACNIPKDPSRIQKGHEAAEFFMRILNAPCDRIAVENPPPMKRFGLPQYSQIVYPYMFGEKYTKRIGLWLKGLPPLVPTDVVSVEDMPRYKHIYPKTGKLKTYSLWYQQGHSKHRSKTFKGVAEAMADQWG